jgi:glycosyltransferase involved in cell wall biosynthesis
MNKIMEYMFFGLPIVCYDLTEHKVSAQDAALYVQANSERALAEGISSLLDGPVRRACMSEYGAKRVREKLVWQHSVPSLLRAYDAIFARVQPLARTTACSKEPLSGERPQMIDRATP